MWLLLSIFIVLIALMVWSLIDKEIPPLVKPLTPSQDMNEGGELLDGEEDIAGLSQATPKIVQTSSISVYVYDEAAQTYISNNLSNRFEAFGEEHQKEIIYKHPAEIGDTTNFVAYGPEDIVLFCFLVHKDADLSETTPYILRRVEQTQQRGGTLFLGLLHSDDTFAHTYTTEQITLGDRQISCIHFFAPYELASEKLSKIV